MKVVDDNGVEYKPEKMTITSGPHELLAVDTDICVISSEAVPLNDRFFTRNDRGRLYPYFEVPDGGAIDTKTSLAATKRELLDSAIVGFKREGEFSDEFSKWPLYGSEWR